MLLNSTQNNWLGAKPHSQVMKIEYQYVVMQLPGSKVIMLLSQQLVNRRSFSKKNKKNRLTISYVLGGGGGGGQVDRLWAGGLGYCPSSLDETVSFALLFSVLALLLCCDPILLFTTAVHHCSSSCSAIRHACSQLLCCS